MEEKNEYTSPEMEIILISEDVLTNSLPEDPLTDNPA